MPVVVSASGTTSRREYEVRLMELSLFSADRFLFAEEVINCVDGDSNLLDHSRMLVSVSEKQFGFRQKVSGIKSRIVNFTIHSESPRMDVKSDIVHLY